MRFTVRVPATSANLGPGFDCFALALDLFGGLCRKPHPGFELAERQQRAGRKAEHEDPRQHRNHPAAPVAADVWRIYSAI